jgi:hypothetical protein
MTVICTYMFLRSSPESKSLAEIYFSLAHTISKLWSSFCPLRCIACSGSTKLICLLLLREVTGLLWLHCFSQLAASNAPGTELNLPLSDTRTARTRRSRSFRVPTHVRSRPTVLGHQYRQLYCCPWSATSRISVFRQSSLITR